MDIKQTAHQTGTAENGIATPAPLHHKVWIGTYAFLGIACLILYFLLQLDFLHLLGGSRNMVQKIVLAAAISFVVLLLAKLAERIVAAGASTKSAKYNVVRLIRLLAVLVILLIFISVLFQNWYTAAVSLGLISLILGFALQIPISSFIGWVYIILRNPYHVGDQVQIADFTGDVVEIGYLDTTLWEFAGDYLTNDMPSGRLIRFPNSMIFQSAVYNYSWEKFPFIWNEIPFHIAYESDLSFVAATLKQVAGEVLGPDMPAHVQTLQSLIRENPVDELEIQEYPYVSFRTNTNTWLEATVTYLVKPKQATSVLTNILMKTVAALLQEPDKVMFPKSNAR